MSVSQRLCLKSKPEIKSKGLNFISIIKITINDIIAAQSMLTMYYDLFSLLLDGFQGLDPIRVYHQPWRDKQFLKIYILEVAACDLAMADFKWFRIIQNLNLTDRIYVLI